MACPPRRALSRFASPRTYAATLLLLAVWLPTSATTLIELQELPELVKESRRAVLGEVVNVRYGLDDHGLHSTWVRVRVDEALYGDTVPGSGQILTVKLYGAPFTMPDGSRIFIDGTPVYRPGERYLLLLRGESELGFTNVAGLYQGAFRTAVDAGEETAQSLSGNRNVFGRGGLGRWLTGENLTEAQRERLTEDPDAPVPYPLLRRAVLALWSEGGAR